MSLGSRARVVDKPTDFRRTEEVDKKSLGDEHMMISKCIGIGPKFEVKPESNVFSHRVRRASVQDGVDVQR